MTPELRAAVFALPAEERRKLAEDLLDSVDEDDLPPLTDAQFEELERRRMHLEAHPESARPWDEVYARLKAKYGG